MLKIKIKTSYIVIIPLLMLLAGAAVWLMTVRAKLEPCGTDYQWLNPALDCENKPVISKVTYLTFKNKLANQIDAWKKEGKVEEVAVFFRDLENGPTFGINDRQSFVPKSLLKVPIMFTFFTLAEEDSELLQKPLVWSSKSAEISLPQSVPDELMLEQDKPYTINELIFRMIAYSDNHSMRLLEAYAYALSQEYDLIDHTYVNLGLMDPEDRTPGKLLSVKSYASLFRLLYNASYLSNEFSEKALEYLIKTEFKGGIAGGVPEGIVVAHKFGERLQQQEESMQLHDCGIIYYPDNPYILCVMTVGGEYENLKEVLRDISQAVWGEISSRQL